MFEKFPAEKIVGAAAKYGWNSEHFYAIVHQVLDSVARESNVSVERYEIIIDRDRTIATLRSQLESAQQVLATIKEDLDNLPPTSNLANRFKRQTKEAIAELEPPIP